MEKTIKLLTAAVVIAVVFAFAGCGKDKNTKQLTELEKIQKAGVITVGTSPDYPPFESIDDEGNIIGFDLDLAKAVAKDLGVEIKIVSMGFDSIITAVKNGQIDIGVSSFSVNEERKMSIDFSVPYISSSQVILVQKDSEIKSKEDLKGQVVASQMGTTGAEAAKEIENVDLKTVEDYNVATMMLDNGSVKAVVLDIAIAKELASKHDFKVLEKPLNHEDTAIVMKKGSTDLKASIDKSVEKMLQDGTIDKMKKEWKVQ